jgi:hypothetical protein
MDSEFKIPSEFQISGKTYKVSIKEGLIKTGRMGQTDFNSLEIWLDSDLKPEDIKAVTYFHELVHAIFESLGKDDLCSDEGLVDSFAGLLWQSIKTSKFD